MDRPGLNPTSGLPDPHRRTRRDPRRGLQLRWDDVHVEGIASAIPPVERTTASLEDGLRPLYRRLGFKPGWVEAVTGIASRRMWAPGQSAIDGAVEAATTAMQRAGVVADEVDLVISCSVYKPRLEPSMACEIQGALGMGHATANHDVSNACLGFLTGLVQAANAITLRQAEVALVVAGEDAAPVLDATLQTLRAPSADIHAFKANLATLTLGSAAAAVVLTHADRAHTGHRLLGGTLWSATQHHDLCVGDTRGMQTDAVKLLREGVALARQAWDDVRPWLGWDQAPPSTYALHQVGQAHHDTVLRAMGVPTDHAPRIYPWLGNVGACGVPVTAALAVDQGHVRPGDALALMGIGSGLNVAMLGVTW